MAVKYKMDNTELITELLQALTNDVDGLKKWAKQVPTTPAPDHQANLDQLTTAIEQLRQQNKTSAPALIDTGAINAQLARIEQRIQKSPEYRAGQYVKWGAYASGLMVVLLMSMTGLALKWKVERDKFEVSDWKWRAVSQEQGQYGTKLDGMFATDSTAQRSQQWILEQEQADATREAAQKAQAKAAAMNAQADKLEGKKRPIGKKRT